MVEVNNKTRSKINLALVNKAASKFLLKHKLSNQQVSIVFVGDSLIRSLNKQYRKIDKITDVLSFCDKESVILQKNFLGEIIIDFQQIKRQAKSLKHSVQEELIYILVHGLLHLAGHDHKTAQQSAKMDKLAAQFITNLKL